MLEANKLYKVWTGGNKAATKAIADLLQNGYGGGATFLHSGVGSEVATYVVFNGFGVYRSWSARPETDLNTYYLGDHHQDAEEIGVQKAIEELSKLPHNQPKETVTIAGKTFDKKEFENAIARLEEV